MPGEDLGLPSLVPPANKHGEGEEELLPGYTPTVFLEAALPQQSLELRQGDGLPLRLRLMLPESLIDALGRITLYSLQVVLVGTTTTAGGIGEEPSPSLSHVTLLSACPGLSFMPNPGSRLNLRSYGIACDALGKNNLSSHCVIPRNIAPSSEACGVFGHRYALLVRVGLCAYRNGAVKSRVSWTSPAWCFFGVSC